MNINKCLAYFKITKQIIHMIIEIIKLVIMSLNNILFTIFENEITYFVEKSKCSN